MTDSGRVLVQLAQQRGDVTAIGFAGPGFDYDLFPNNAALVVDKLYLPHKDDPANPQVLEGVQGTCIFEGKINVRYLKTVACIAKIELGNQRLFYHLEAEIHSPGDPMH